MENFKNQILSIYNGDYSEKQLVSILILCVKSLNLDTVSEMARKEGKTRRGIIVSKNYKKVRIGKQLFAIKGIEEDGLPF